MPVVPGGKMWNALSLASTAAVVAGFPVGAVAASRCSSSTVTRPAVSAPLSVIGSMKSVSATTAFIEPITDSGADTAGLVVVQHPGDRPALDGGQHQQHRLR